MLHERWIYFRVFGLLCLGGAILSGFKAIRTFSLNPRQLGTPRGVAEDWILLVLVLLAAAWVAWNTHDVAMVGRAAIVVFSICFAVISFQDVVEGMLGIGSRYIEGNREAIRKDTLWGGVSSVLALLNAVGIFRWRSWGQKLCLAICILLLIGTIVYAAEEGFDWRFGSSFSVLIGAILWLYHPSVSIRFQASKVQ